MSAVVRWGVIGCGGIAARRTIPEVMRHDGIARIIAVMDTRGDVARSVAARFSIPHSCDTESELLNQDIDAVYIATPVHLHSAQAVRAAEAGKHVLCEKPLCLTLAEAAKMERAAATAGVSLMPAYSMRFNAHHVKARELVQSGKWGQLVMARAQLTCWYPPDPHGWRDDLALSGGGSFSDMGVHCLDLLEWIGGARAVEITAMQGQLTHAYRTPIEDVSAVLVRFAGGAQAMIDNCFNIPDGASPNRLELYCTGGAILGCGTIGQEPTGSIVTLFQLQTVYEAQQVHQRGRADEQHTLPGEGNYAAMVNAFSHSILDGTAPPVPVADGIHLVQATRAVYRSAAERRVVRVDEVQD